MAHSMFVVLAVGMSVHANPRKTIAGSSGSGTFDGATPTGAVALGTPTALSLYTMPPTEEITLQQFEGFAMERLSVLKNLETGKAKGLKGPEWTDHAKKTLAKSVIQRHPQIDKIGHHILRLAFCKTEENRRWFLSQETLLFRFRFEESDSATIDRFFKENQLTYHAIPPEKLDHETREKIRPVAPNSILDDGGYYLVRWEEALELVQKKKVYLVNGKAYVGRKDLVSLVVAKFRARLSRDLNTTYRLSQNLSTDKRLKPLLSAISKNLISATPAYKSNALLGAVTAADVPLLAKVSMPLCMQNLNEALVADGHLKHGGRMQYGLFLKGIGLSLKEALQFWAAAMAKKTPGEKFNKEYAYNIRHNYGQEGKRTQYTPYGCAKIIAAQPTTADHHGCPFRHWDEAHLTSKISQEFKRRGVDGAAAASTEIIRLVKEQHYQLACQRYFSATHKGIPPDAVGNHPNTYFDSSRKFLVSSAATAATGTAPTAAAASSSSSAAAAADATASPTKNTATTATTAATPLSPPAHLPSSSAAAAASPATSPPAASSAAAMAD